MVYTPFKMLFLSKEMIPEYNSLIQYMFKMPTLHSIQLYSKSPILLFVYPSFFLYWSSYIIPVFHFEVMRMFLLFFILFYFILFTL